MKEIQLTRGKTALVDDQDFEFLNQWKWCAKKDKYTYYAYRRDYSLGKRNSVAIVMHRLVLGLTDSKIEGEHVDGNGLNNQRDNLRTATRSQNCANRPSFKNSFSKYKGVTWKKQNRKWRSTIQKDGILIHIGYFESEKDAAVAYNQRAIELHGEFARLNEVA